RTRPPASRERRAHAAGEPGLDRRQREACGRGCGRRERLELPASVLLHEHAVRVELPVAAKILDDVPVDAAHIRAAGGAVGVADREVDGAVDLLVEADVLREALDARVAADAELAEPARAFVGIERSQQEGLAAAPSRARSARARKRTAR